MSVNSDTRGGDIGILGYWDIGILGYWDIGRLGDWGVGLILQHKIHEVVFFC